MPNFIPSKKSDIFLGVNISTVHNHLSTFFFIRVCCVTTQGPLMHVPPPTHYGGRKCQWRVCSSLLVCQHYYRVYRATTNFTTKPGYVHYVLPKFKHYFIMYKLHIIRIRQLATFFRAPGWLVAMGWPPSSCVSIFFLRTTEPILTKFGM